MQSLALVNLDRVVMTSEMSASLQCLMIAAKALPLTCGKDRRRLIVFLARSRKLADGADRFDIALRPDKAKQSRNWLDEMLDG